MKCSHKNCRAHSLTDGNECYQHSQDPSIIAQRTEARKRGGRRKAQQAQHIDSIDSIEDLQAILLSALNELQSCGSENVIGKCRAVGFLVKTAADLLLAGELEERIAKLEQAQERSRELNT